MSRPGVAMRMSQRLDGVSRWSRERSVLMLRKGMSARLKHIRTSDALCPANRMLDVKRVMRNQAGRLLLDLQRELACRGQHEDADALVVARLRLLCEVLDRREEEGKGLAGAGLRLNEEVFACEGGLRGVSMGARKWKGEAGRRTSRVAAGA